MKIQKLFVVLFFLISNPLIGQEYSGFVLDSETGSAIEFVNIGIAGKNKGTVSDLKGEYSINLDPQYDNETLVFSCIGYLPFSLKVSEFKALQSHSVKMKERIVELQEVIVYPKVFEQKNLGVSPGLKVIQAGFADNLLGYECGILMKVKKSAILETLNIEIGSCSYDSILYRVNVYKVIGKMEFENILITPIYLKLPKERIKETISVDLKPYNLLVQGDFLVTLEHIKYLGDGYLNFWATFSKKTYYRKTSQGNWDKVPVGVGINVDAKVEM